MFEKVPIFPSTTEYLPQNNDKTKKKPGNFLDRLSLKPKRSPLNNRQDVNNKGKKL